MERKSDGTRLCPYLDTINRQLLDFDFEKLCSVSLSRHNVYACLVCGKYFQGRGINTHAYTHSVAESHHVFLNLQSLKFYCLPDNYEIVGKYHPLLFYQLIEKDFLFNFWNFLFKDSSLDDIKYVLNPTFDELHQIEVLDKSDKLSRAIDGSLYSPGIVGMNNIKANDYCNVILQVIKIWCFANFFQYFGSFLTWKNLMFAVFVACRSSEGLFFARGKLLPSEKASRWQLVSVGPAIWWIDEKTLEH